MQSKPNCVILDWNHLSTELSCQRLAKPGSKQSEGQESFTLSHHFYLPHGSQNEWMRARARERGKRAPHDSTVIGSFSSLWTQLHPSIDPLNCPKTSASHVTAALETRKHSHSDGEWHWHTHAANHARTIRHISFNSIPTEVETPAADCGMFWLDTVHAFLLFIFHITPTKDYSLLQL